MNVKNVLSGALFIIFFAGFQVEAAKSFTDNGNGTVMDNDTGLIWQQGEGWQSYWILAPVYCENLSLAAKDDWRLPSTALYPQIITS